jgi:hypothetical protein
MFMNTNKLHVFGSMTAMFLVATVAFAQDATDDIGPAVDTSAVVQEDADDSPTSVEPGVDTSASDIRPAPSSQRSRVMDSMQLDRTEITGNQELPKVLYIVPWKKSNPGDLMGRPVIFEAGRLLQ